MRSEYYDKIQNFIVKFFKEKFHFKFTTLGLYWYLLKVKNNFFYNLRIYTHLYLYLVYIILTMEEP